MYLSVSCYTGPDMEWSTLKILVVTETGTKLQSKTFILKNTTNRENIALAFVEWSVVKY